MLPAAASAGTTYNSTATATAGSVSIAGNNVPVPDNSVTATDKTGPQAAGLGISALESALPSSAGPLVAAFKAALPNGANLVSETATAASNGNSTACAGFLLTGECTTNGKPQPLTLSLSMADLPGLPSGPSGTSGGTDQSQATHQQQQQSPQLVPSSDVPSSLKQGLSRLAPGSAPDSASESGSGSGSSPSPSPSVPDLSGFKLVLSLAGPQAACTAGPDGSSGSGFTATQSLASASVEIQQNGKSIVGPIALKSGDILSQLPSSLPPALTQALGNASLTQASPVNLTINPGSTSGAGSGPSTTATAGELGLSANGTQILDLKGAQAKCGPNKAAVGAAPKPATKTTSSEKPLGGGIQTDEGRSGSGSDPALWAGVAGAAVLGGTASGLTLWRRRRNAL